ncbi:MAG TPA: carboxypeptidase regulatory-like domain-containing protein [Gemmatimonadaceae bacterium]|nr:carboxypeptidase regulatory-like domain-containing protein [Gemmatimonadaceae bacterium]
MAAARFLLAASALALLVARPLPAQAGGTTDIVMGQVVGPDSTPLTGARVEVTSQETGITRRTTTNSDGRYAVVFPNGGGSYALSITYLGMARFTRTVTRQGEEDRLVVDAVMGHTATRLATVEVVARRARPQTQFQPPAAGGTERNLPAGSVSRMPVDAGDLNALATLAPGVIGLPGTDSTPNSFSVAGQAPDQNNITLDGLSFGSGSVPQEAIRGTRVVTSTYDVARGQFTGGQVTSTTRGGTSQLQGSVNYSMREPSLAFVDNPGGFTRKYRQNQLSVGLGGPLVRDRAFGFGAFQWSRRTDDVLSLIAADPLTLQRLGTHPDSVSRFVGILDQFSLPPLLASREGRRVADNGSALLRLDYNVTDAHTLMLRGDWRLSTQEPSRISPTSVPHSGGDSRASGRGGMVQLTSTFGSFINELRAYGSGEKRDVTSYLDVPDGRVLVSARLDDGTRAISTLSFGGNPSLPQETRSSLFELSNEISLLSRRGGHRYKLGGLLNEERSSVGFIPNRWGTFTFNSLEEFEAGEAAVFTRTLRPGDRRSATRNMALYVGDGWRRSASLQFVYGLRIEASLYPDAPDHNPDIGTLFGRRTDRFPSDFHVSPRAGFTWNVVPEIGGPPTFTVRGGVGEFRGRAASQLFATARNATGLADGQSQLTCIGEGVPVPDWEGYLADAGTIPASCAAGLPGAPPGQRRDVTVFNPAFGAPRAWRASLGATRRIAERFTLNVDASYARGVSLTGIRDINLDTVPEFSLSGEAGRPVYVAPGSIIPATGATSLNASRVHSDYARVSEVMSELSSDTRQLTASFNGLLLRGVQFNLSYTFTSSRDQAQGFSSPSLGGFGGRAFTGVGFGGGGGTTAGNPNRAEWGQSDIARRHSMLGTVSYRFRPWLDITAIGRVVSGSRYSPLVGGDINGDGLRNDRAFVFDPGSPIPAGDTALSNAISRLLASGSGAARECLQNQLGRIAERNSCAGPWTPSLDLQFNIRPAALGPDRRLTISVLALNVLAGVDQLLHSTENLRGWGQPAFVDRTLLYVRGFDPESQSFSYEVNENFGSTSQRSGFRVPFQIALQARMTLGADQVQAQFRRVVAGGAAGGQAGMDAIRQRMVRTMPNAFLDILEIADSAQLNLTQEQQARLVAAGDSFQIQADTLVGTIAAVLSGLSAQRSPDPSRLAAQLQPQVREARQMAVQAVREAQRILTAEQWARVPEAIRQPFRPREGGPGFMFMGPP